MVVTRYWGDDCDNEVEDHCQREPDGKQDRGEAGVCYYATRPKDGADIVVRLVALTSLSYSLILPRPHFKKKPAALPS